MFLNCGVGEDSWESLGLQGDPTSPSWRKSVLNIHWKDWRWSWNSSTLATWCEELTHLKRPWWRERLKVEGEGDDRGWDGWMASVCTWVWVNSKSSDMTDWLNWTELIVYQEEASNSLQYSCLENPHGQRSLAVYSPWGLKESDTTEQPGIAVQGDGPSPGLCTSPSLIFHHSVSQIFFSTVMSCIHWLNKYVVPNMRNKRVRKADIAPDFRELAL